MKYTLNTWGLTHRQLFSAMCLQGMLSNSALSLEEFTFEEYAKDAVAHADALIAELGEKEQTETPKEPVPF